MTSCVLFKILYDQSSAGSRKFAIEPERGLITTQGELDRETTSNYTVSTTLINCYFFILCKSILAMFCIFQLIVEAKALKTDLELNLLSSVVPVFINVSDVDDNVPRFVQRSYR